MTVTYDEATARLLGLLQALADAGMASHLVDARALLNRAAEMDRQAGEGSAQAERTRAELVAAVADGTLTLAEAVAKLDALAPWLASGSGIDSTVTEALDGAPVTRYVPGGLAGAFVRPVVAEMHARAVRSARADGHAVHGALAARAGAAVRRAVEAGRRLIDVRAITTALTPPKVAYGAPHPWLTNPPTLPTLELSDVQSDPDKMAHWATAAAGLAEWREMHRLAGLLHAVIGGSSTSYAGKTDDDAWYFIKRLPDVVHLAVVDALGWKPGLHLSTRPAARRPQEDGADKMAGWATPAQQQNAVRRLLGKR